MIIRQNNNGKANVVAAGFVARDAELSTVGVNKVTVCKFSLKVTSGKDELDVWENCVAWHNVAKQAAAIRKGDNIMVAGIESSREYNGKTYTDCNVDFVQIMGKASAPAIQKLPPMPDMEEVDNDSLPF